MFSSINVITKYVREPNDNTSVLGSGVFGKIYRMRSENDCELYAVKAIDVAGAKTKGISTVQLLKEVRVLYQVNHPHLVKYFNCFYTDQNSFFNITMELVVGSTITIKINDLSVSISEKIKWWTQIASALCHLHSCDFLHRDLKPDNIMINAYNDIKIIDLGLASIVSASVSSGHGTLLYFSPERTMGQLYDGKDDVWAAGYVMLQLLATTKPNETELMEIKFNNDLRLRFINNCIAVDVQYGYILDQMLQLARSKRCSSNVLLDLLSTPNVSPINLSPQDLVRAETLTKTLKLKNILKATIPDRVIRNHLKAFNYQPNSRAWLHFEVDEWLATTPSNEKDLKNKVFWLQAGAGMGKSVFAAALVDRLNRETDCRLLGAVFINFNDEKASNPINVLKSLIYQIALRYLAIDFVVKTLESVKNESESVMLFFEVVLIPLLNDIVGEHNFNDNSCNLLIVIDALDEAGVEGSELRRRFLELFSMKYLRKFPLRVKLLVTGRPEVDVKDKLLSYSHVIDENDERHVNDLMSYIRFSLEQVFDDRVVVDAATAILLSKCENKFLYTAVVAEQISEWYSEDDGATFSVNDFMLKLNSLPEGIDGSYRQTFVKLSKTVRGDKWHEFLMCMVSSVEPLSECELKFLLNMESSSQLEFSRLVDHVVTVFPLRESLEGGVNVKKFYPFHKSIIHWLNDDCKSGEFYCDAKESNLLLTKKLLSKFMSKTSDRVDVNNIKVNVNLWELMNKNENIERYLFEHLLTHLDKCDEQLNYQYVSHYLLTYLPWIQCCLKLFGVHWLIQNLNNRKDVNSQYYDSKFLSDISFMYNFLLLFAESIDYLMGNNHIHELCYLISSKLIRSSSERIKQLARDAADLMPTLHDNEENASRTFDHNFTFSCDLCVFANGAFGHSFRCKNLNDNGVYVVKALHAEKINSREIDKFQLELELYMLRSMNHSFIVKYCSNGFNTSNAFYYVVMENIVGESLSNIIQVEQSISDVVKWFKQIASALYYIHFEKMLQHRDIKPDNILISNGDVKIVDFGLECVMNARMSLARNVNTTIYFSYEKAFGFLYDGRDDVWALGCVMAELLVSKRLMELGGGLYNFRNENVNIRRKKLISECLDKVPHLGSLIGKMLEPEQANRCTSRYLNEELNGFKHSS